MILVLEIIFICLSGLVLTITNGIVLNILQQSNYCFSGVIKWLKSTRYSVIARQIAFPLVTGCLMLLFTFAFPYKNFEYILLAIFTFFAVLYICLIFKTKTKVQLKFTARMKRLAVLATILSFGIASLVHLFSVYTFVYCLYTLVVIFSIPVIFISHMILLPFEKLVQKSYINKTKKIIANMKKLGLKVIGITGSYGKTTTRNILCTMLSTKYKVCGGKANYNTPMGLSRIVNEVLATDDEILIVEMGARRIGDVLELCNIAKPDMGIMTAVGNQHLEFFGSVENIKKGKSELANNLVGDIMSFNGDNEIACELYSACGLAGKMITGESNKFDISYDNVVVDEFGTKFDVKFDNNTYSIRTILLGDYVPSLIVLAMSLAIKLGVSVVDCCLACSELQPVEHRLQLINVSGNIIIDDAYNSNPRGALSALKLLAKFSDTKVIITPGMVELGSQEEMANKQFGIEIAQYADVAILVGKHADTMKGGALSAGMNENNIITVKSLDDAKDYLANMNEGKKVILFENDLTDCCG